MSSSYTLNIFEIDTVIIQLYYSILHYQFIQFSHNICVMLTFFFSEESYITKMEYGFDLHDIEIIDTAGQEEFMFFRDSSLSKGDAFLGLFAVNSDSSWHDVKELRSKIIRENDDDGHIPLVFIANKCVSMYICSSFR